MASRTVIGVFYPTRFTPITDTQAPFVATDVTNGNQTANDGCTWMEIQNTDGANPHTLTLNVPSGFDGLAAGPRQYVLAASVTERTGAFPINFYSNTLQYNTDSALLKVRFFSLL